LFPYAAREKRARDGKRGRLRDDSSRRPATRPATRRAFVGLLRQDPGPLHVTWTSNWAGSTTARVEPAPPIWSLDARARTTSPGSHGVQETSVTRGQNRRSRAGPGRLPAMTSARPAPGTAFASGIPGRGGGRRETCVWGMPRSGPAKRQSQQRALRVLSRVFHRLAEIPTSPRGWPGAGVVRRAVIDSGQHDAERNGTSSGSSRGSDSSRRPFAFEQVATAGGRASGQRRRDPADVASFSRVLAGAVPDDTVHRTWHGRIGWWALQGCWWPARQPVGPSCWRVFSSEGLQLAAIRMFRRSPWALVDDAGVGRLEMYCVGVQASAPQARGGRGGTSR